MALQGTDRSERKRQERRARERAERFAALEQQLEKLQARIYALPDDDTRTAMRLTTVAEELRLLHPDAITEREEAIARITAIVAEAEGRPVVRGRTARYDRSELPVRGGRARPIRGSRRG